MTSRHAHNDSTANTTCPTCQGNEKMRREIDDEADAEARKRFRLFVVLYLVYPFVILSLLAVIGAGTYVYLKGEDSQPGPIASPQPPWCYPGSMAGYGPPPPATAGGYEPAIMPSGSFTPQIGIPNIADTVQTAGNSARDRIAYYVAVSIRAADGAQDARYQRSLIGLSQVELGMARQKFVERSRKDGRLGFIRLGITQLGTEAYDIAKWNGLMVPFCAPNDFVTPDKRAAYVNFAIASYCDTAGATRANDWLLAVAGYERYSDEQKASMQSEAANYLAGEPRACAVQLVDTPVDPGGGDDYDDDYGSTSDEGGDYTDPGSSSSTSSTESDTSPDFSRSRRGERMSDEERNAAEARWYLARGDAALSSDDIRRARALWQRAIDRGRRHGAQASIIAQKRLQSYTLTCYPRDRNLKRMSNDYVALQGDLVDMRAIQQALYSLGHYDGPTNGSLGPLTRAAIRKFQREMAFDETDTLTPRQTVYVICNAAQIARDPSSQNILGIMYATGLGVRLNVDLALEWLRTSSGRRYDKATYHLAVIYGTGIVLKSYRLCDIPRNLEQADQYLREAASQGNGDAIAAWRKYGHKSPAARWQAIEDELLNNPTFRKAKEDLTDIGKTCEKRYEPGPRGGDVAPSESAPAPAPPPPPPSKSTAS